MKYEILKMKNELLKINLLHKEDKKVDHVYTACIELRARSIETGRWEGLEHIFMIYKIETEEDCSCQPI